MPYGLSRKIGADTPENTAKMERCVEKVMKKGKPKENAIRICKHSIMRSRLLQKD